MYNQLWLKLMIERKYIDTAFLFHIQFFHATFMLKLYITQSRKVKRIVSIVRHPIP